MAEIRNLPKANIIRTYPNDYAESDSELDVEAQFETDLEDEDEHPISTRLEQNLQYMGEQINPPSGQISTWILEPQDWKTTKGSNVVLIRKPTASNMSHRLLNPYLYRNIQNVGTMDDLARLLNAPETWESLYHQVVADGRVNRKLNRLTAMPDGALEGSLQSQLVGIVENISERLNIDLVSYNSTKVIVGGILAKYEYDVRSQTDPHFLNDSGMNLIASEVKRNCAFPPGQLWYHESRGVQVLSALYSFNAPTFLFTQKQWKLFVENDERNAVFTFPFDDNPNHSSYVNSTLMKPMGTTFLKAIVICLLSRRASLLESMQELNLEESSQVAETPKKTVTNPKYFDTPEKPKRQSARLQGRPKPSYVSGYDDQGEPVYSLVRLVPKETVEMIENEITVKEKLSWQKENSQITLFEKNIM